MDFTGELTHGLLPQYILVDEHDHWPASSVPALAWHHASAVQQRPESALTGASQPSPTPSVSWTAPVAPMAAAPAQAPAPAPAKGSKAAKPRRPGGKGCITLRLLIEEGILQPGHDVLSVDYKGMKQVASLMPDGRISSTIGGQQMVFESPSAFSIYLKRLVNPSRKADDGWKTVRYNNRVLEQYKLELTQQRMGNGSAGAALVPEHMLAPHAAPLAKEPQQEQRQQPASKRARVDSSNSDLTGGSVAVSATVKEGDRNVLKLKFARPKKGEEGAGPATAPQGFGQPAAAAHLPSPQAAEEQGELGDYPRMRPRRQVQKPPRYGALGHDDEHALQPLEAYGPGPPGAPGAQPYGLYVSPAAELTMDHHAHLCLNEVIGMLAGTFEPSTRTISVLCAHPVRELATEDDSINVEMDPEDEWRVRQQIAESGLRVVGWYHSHPTFPTQPSTIDIYNQVLQQHHHREEESGAEPYVAAIVGPYDKRLSGPHSSITWFYVDHPPKMLPSVGQCPDDVGCVAKALQVVQLADSGSCDIQAEIVAMPAAIMLELMQRYVGKRDAVDMTCMWRDGSTFAQKLVASLLTRLPPQWSATQQQDFATRVQTMVATASLYKLPAAPSEPGNGTAAAVPGLTTAAASIAYRAAAAPESDDEAISDISD